MRTIVYLGLMVGLLGAISVASAFAADDGLDKASREALEQVQKELNDPNFMNNLKANGNGDQQNAIGIMQQATANDPALFAQANGISSDIFAKIVQKTGGDTSKIMEILRQAQKDPKGFMASLDQEDQNKIRNLAGQVEAKQKANSSTTPK